MKRQLIFSLLVSFLISATAAESEVSKVINKNFKVSSTTLLSVRNSFGKIHVNTWEKSEISVEIEIIGNASNEERAQKIIDNIDISVNETSSEVSLITNIKDSKSRGNSGYEINYTINMPVENPINFRNSFGDIYLPTRKGDAFVKVGYGALKAQDFLATTEMEISFGSGSVGRFEKGELEVKYSDVEIESAGEMIIDQGFSNLEIDQIDELDLESKYGDVRLGKAGFVKADVGFSGFKMGELSGSLDLEADYVSGFEIDLLRKEFDFVRIYGKFGSYDIRLEDGLSADLEAEFRYSDLKTYGDEVDFHYRIKESNLAEYRGKIGGGSYDKIIKIKSSYGDCTISN